MAVTSFSPQREKQEEKQKAAIMAANTSEGLKPEYSESWCVYVGLTGHSYSSVALRLLDKSGVINTFP